MVKSIDVDMILLVHQLIAEETGGGVGIHDENLLQSSIAGVFQTFDGKELYPSKEEKAARLGYNFVSNHVFVDGNKRMGMHIMILFLEINGIHLKYTQSELADLGWKIADGKFKYEQILAWILSHK